MKRFSSIWGDESGSAIVIALLTLAALTIVGVSSTTMTTTELIVVRNERIYKENFYLAEAAVNEAGQRIENASDEDLNNLTPTWLTENEDLDDTDNWTDTNSTTSSYLSGAQYSAYSQGIVSGGSLDMTASSSVYGFTIRGYSSSYNGAAMIEIGYKKRY